MRRTKEDAEATRQRVIETALRLFGRSGYSATTLKAIAAEAGFSRGPIYWHFRNKVELYEAVMEISQVPLERLVRETRESAATPMARIDRFVERWLQLLTDDALYRASFEILLNKSELTDELAGTIARERALTRSIIALFTDLVTQARASGELAATGDSPEELGLVCYTYLMGITQTWLFDPSLFDLAAETRFLQNRLRRLIDAPTRDAHG